MTLLEITEKLGEYDTGDEEESETCLTIYAAHPWTPESNAIVHATEHDVSRPAEAKQGGLIYFLDILTAREFLEGWVESEYEKPSARARCERLIQYAINDA